MGSTSALPGYLDQLRVSRLYCSLRVLDHSPGTVNTHCPLFVALIEAKRSQAFAHEIIRWRCFSGECAAQRPCTCSRTHELPLLRPGVAVSISQSDRDRSRPPPSHQQRQSFCASSPPFSSFNVVFLPHRGENSRDTYHTNDSFVFDLRPGSCLLDGLNNFTLGERGGPRRLLTNCSIFNCVRAPIHAIQQRIKLCSSCIRSRHLFR